MQQRSFRELAFRCRRKAAGRDAADVPLRACCYRRFDQGKGVADLASGIHILWITGSELDLSSTIGLMMVVGVVTEVANFHFAELDVAGKIGEADLIEAARMRLRPISMASSIAILALMPLALGFGCWFGHAAPLGGAHHHFWTDGEPTQLRAPTPADSCGTSPQRGA